ncbi:hypothetical protein BB347_11830 [Natronorubrum daqingense]|uniref:Uncharacterized protein n=1 Tax=Natronorubrum daqingense TaxID=588898 RepID=A0A1P8RF69_9EURY|nr:hypothetical protein BB347_11830 [Natronorubrum daqingense]
MLFAAIFGVVFLGPILSFLVYPLSSLELFVAPIGWIWPAFDRTCTGTTCAITGLFGLYAGYSLLITGGLTAVIWTGLQRASPFVT